MNYMITHHTAFPVSIFWCRKKGTECACTDVVGRVDLMITRDFPQRSVRDANCKLNDANSRTLKVIAASHLTDCMPVAVTWYGPKLMLSKEEKIELIIFF